MHNIYLHDSVWDLPCTIYIYEIYNAQYIFIRYCEIYHAQYIFIRYCEIYHVQYIFIRYCEIYHVQYTVESPNKGHFGTNINSSGLSTK